MKKIKPLLLFLFIAGTLQISCTTNKLQQNFTGVWQLKTINGNGRDVGTFKIYDEKGNYYLLRNEPNGALLPHKGTFKVKNDSVYVEHAEKQRYDALYAFEEEGCPINYEFINHATVMRIHFSANQKSGVKNVFTEIWEKVTVPDSRGDMVKNQ